MVLFFSDRIFRSTALLKPRELQSHKKSAVWNSGFYFCDLQLTIAQTRGDQFPFFLMNRRTTTVAIAPATAPEIKLVKST
jgi:hypothetical protein